MNQFLVLVLLIVASTHGTYLNGTPVTAPVVITHAALLLKAKIQVTLVAGAGDPSAWPPIPLSVIIKKG